MLSLRRWSINDRKVASSSLLQRRNTSPELLRILLLSISVRKPTCYWFKLWIKIQRKLEILDLNLGGILHRYLDQSGNLLLHFSHLATVALPGPASLYPSYNKTRIKSHQRYLSRQNQAGATVRNEKFDVSVSIVLSPTAARSTKERWLFTNTSSTLRCTAAHITCVVQHQPQQALQLGQLTIATAVIPLPGVLETALLLFHTETAEWKINRVINISCYQRKGNQVKL